MRSLLFILSFFAFLSCPPAWAQGRMEEPPSIDEYKDVPQGLLLPDKDVVAAEESLDDSNAVDGAERALSMDEILTAYRQGKYDVLARNVMPLAENGQHKAEELLGIMYLNGQGITKNIDKAVIWLTKAADANQPLAQHHLGVLYYTGTGVQTDYIKALMWLHLAIVHYADGPEKKRAVEDRESLNTRLSRRDKDRALSLARDWLDKKDERYLIDRLVAP